ncbi:uncharacterized protein [Spinacia oleracea]|uniref:Uncharacterized protein isoform X2 n=1 Tax=Spinacia oleracea TaxID=3562 RepID=A0ABM3RFP6_SPIOL|nr:uncharacterized protein LOC130469318 isoform X2 [Spinacia oleracea]
MFSCSFHHMIKTEKIVDNFLDAHLSKQFYGKRLTTPQLIYSVRYIAELVCTAVQGIQQSTRSIKLRTGIGTCFYSFPNLLAGTATEPTQQVPIPIKGTRHFAHPYYAINVPHLLRKDHQITPEGSLTFIPLHNLTSIRDTRLRNGDNDTDTTIRVE